MRAAATVSTVGACQLRTLCDNVGMLFVAGNVTLLFVTVGLFVFTVNLQKRR